MKFSEFVNSLLKDLVRQRDNVVLFGQNIDAGSSLSGLTRGLSSNNNSFIINSPNVENTLVGVGFGLMLNGVDSVFFMKQFDFLLLGVDQLVNTYNILRQSEPEASFTIFPVTVDSGFEGPQASLNNFDDFCSLANVPGYSFTNKEDAELILNTYLFKPGFRILSTGQRSLQSEVLEKKIIYVDPQCNFFQYDEGESATIVCFNHSLKYGIELQSEFNNMGTSASLFSFNSHNYTLCSHLMRNIAKTKKLVIIDDSKSRNRVSEKVLAQAKQDCNLSFGEIFDHGDPKDLFFPRSDLLEINYPLLVKKLI